MPSPKYLTPLLEKLGIPNTPAAKASRKAAEEVVMPVSHSQVNNKTRKNKIQKIKKVMERKIALANFLRKNKHPPNVPELNRASNPNNVLINVKGKSASNSENSRTPTPSGWCTSCRRKKPKNGASRRRNRS